MSLATVLIEWAILIKGQYNLNDSKMVPYLQLRSNYLKSIIAHMFSHYDSAKARGTQVHELIKI